MGYFLFNTRHSNRVVQNTIKSNDEYGIKISRSNKNIIKENSFINDGVWLRESYLNNFSNNLVNGKPLIYLENVSDVIINNSSGQLILVNCDNITVKYQNYSNTCIGIILWKTSNLYH